MKKIGILTFQNTRNYGANLQALALQKAVEALGASCEIIDYQCRAVAERERVPRLRDAGSPRGAVRWMFTLIPNRRRERLFRLFRRRCLKLSRQSYDEENIKKANDAYDLFIAGSDQIWNLVLSGGDFSFFLDFVRDNGKKASYAASFGYDVVPEPYLEKCRDSLQKFRYLSVRETKANRLVEKLLGKSAQVVLDPIFLMDRQAWFRFCGPPPIKKNYILLYFLHNEESTFRFARKLARKEHCGIIYINLDARPQPFMENLSAPSPSFFLSLIRNAKYIVTGSFHGAAFSVYFQKQFFLEYSREGNNCNSRLESLLSLLGIEDRRIPGDGPAAADRPIDYSAVNQKLESERQKSIRFLENMIKDFIDE